MRLGITMDTDEGLKGNVSSHFGQCAYFLIVDVENGKIKGSAVHKNTAVHGGGGCVAVDEMRKYEVTHVISGGMGAGAQAKFANAGIRVFAFSGNSADAVEAFFKEALGSLGACKDGHDHH